MEGCPFCGSRKIAKQVDGTYRCAKCDALFDDDPDEGGDHSDRNPAVRIERQERNAKTRK